ncbi:hypothetical protein CN645_16665 [Burkholderia sp. IDO3]|nr:hypothetical protein DCN14_35130 [Burkholderia sp. IDO3]PCD60746.1 hypothetical protein CN645_16665 [Burkholderia sp. IDO3]
MPKRPAQTPRSYVSDCKLKARAACSPGSMNSPLTPDENPARHEPSRTDRSRSSTPDPSRRQLSRA